MEYEREKIERETKDLVGRTREGGTNTRGLCFPSKLPGNQWYQRCLRGSYPESRLLFLVWKQYWEPYSHTSKQIHTRSRSDGFHS